MQSPIKKQQIQTLLNKWDTYGLNKEELCDLEKGLKKLLGAIKMNLLLSERK
jgi:hypothetical protein